MAHFLSDPPDDLKPFDFDDKDGGDDFDDEIGGRIDEEFIPDEDLYDAINDETFGEEMAALTADDDFADFAIRVFFIKFNWQFDSLLDRQFGFVRWWAINFVGPTRP